MATIVVPEKLKKRIQELAKENGMSEQAFVEEAILSFLEDIEDAQLAMERLEAGEEPIPLAEAKKMLGLDDKDDD
jgi:predicted DNA-binding protein